MRAKTFVKKQKLNEDICPMHITWRKTLKCKWSVPDLFKNCEIRPLNLKMLKNVSEEQGLEGWVQAKITKSADYMSSVKHPLEYDMAGDDVTICGSANQS